MGKGRVVPIMMGGLKLLFTLVVQATALAPLPPGQAFFRDVPALPDGRQLSLALGSVAECDTGGRLWPGALVLIRWLCTDRERLQGRTLLELGCGTGAVGIYAAALGAQQVTLSDGQPSVLKLARTNADANCWRELWPEDTTVDVLCLPWGAALPTELRDDVAYDLILGASITYSPALHEALCQSLCALLQHSPDATVWLSHDKRVPIPPGMHEPDVPDSTLENLLNTANSMGLRVNTFHEERQSGRLVSLLEVSRRTGSSR